MPDIAKCLDKDCPEKNKCYRYTAKPSELQVYAFFKWNGGCDDFVQDIYASQEREKVK